MVYLRILSQLVEFILCLFYDAVILTVLPKCAKAIAFYLRTATTAYVSVEEQIWILKMAIAYALLVVVIIDVTLIRCGIRVEPYWLRKRKLLCAISVGERSVKRRYKRGYRS